jgi:hypothetical protein
MTETEASTETNTEAGTGDALAARAREERLLDQVIRFVEPLTRFDRSQLQNVSSSSENVPIIAWQHFGVEFRTEQQSGGGRLPDDTGRLADWGTVLGSVNQAVAEQQAALPGRLSAWMAAQEAEPTTTPLDERDCVSDYHVVGYDETCETCSGYGRLTCGGCDGAGQVTCSVCNGNGEYPCSCSGGQETCPGCGGRGSWTEYETRTSSTGTHGDQVTTTEYVTINVTCGTCNGARFVTCRTCNGRARVPCNTCSRTGQVTCGTCNGDGTVGCDGCDATGWLYHRAWLRADVSLQFLVFATTENGEAREQLQTLPDLAELASLADWVRIEEQKATGDDTLSRKLGGSVPVTTLSLTAVGIPFEIVGYGSSPRVYDYKNLVGRLLEADLTTLEEAVRRTPRYPLGTTTRLNHALAPFLASGANARIGTRMADSPYDLQSSVAGDLQQAVSAEYVTRSTAAVRGSVERVYRAGMPLLIAGLILGPTALRVGAAERHLIPIGALSAIVLGLAAYGIALLVEWLARYRVRRRFAPTLGQAATAYLTDSGIAARARKWYRRSAITGGLFGWLGGAMIIAFLLVRVQMQQRAQYLAATRSHPAAIAPHKAPHKTPPKHLHRR